jgi:hypothetical protein
LILSWAAARRFFVRACCTSFPQGQQPMCTKNILSQSEILAQVFQLPFRKDDDDVAAIRRAGTENCPVPAARVGLESAAKNKGPSPPLSMRASSH